MKKSTYFKPVHVPELVPEPDFGPPCILTALVGPYEMWGLLQEGQLVMFFFSN